MINGFPDNFRMGDDEDVLNEFRQKQASFDLEEKRNEINNSRSLFIGALAGLGMAAVVGWFVLAPQYQSAENNEIPVIRRPQEEVKVPPVEPGNVAIPNQENTVYDIIEKKKEDIEDTKILPVSEQPNADAIEALVEKVSAKEQEEVAESAKGEIKSESLIAPAAKKETTTVPAADVKAKDAEKVQSHNEKEVQKAASEPKEENKTVAEAKPAKQETKVVAKPEQEKKTADKSAVSAKETIAKGAWQIQLMSSPNKKAVEKAWKTMSAKYSALSGQVHEISSTNVGKKGTYYRLRAGNFATKSQATALCNKLKAAGGSCFIARK